MTFFPKRWRGQQATSPSKRAKESRNEKANETMANKSNNEVDQDKTSTK